MSPTRHWDSRRWTLPAKGPAWSHSSHPLIWPELDDPVRLTQGPAVQPGFPAPSGVLFALPWGLLPNPGGAGVLPARKCQGLGSGHLCGKELTLSFVETSKQRPPNCRQTEPQSSHPSCGPSPSQLPPPQPWAVCALATHLGPPAHPSSSASTSSYKLGQSQV